MDPKKKKSRGRLKQAELPGTPKPDECGRTAQNYLTAIEKVVAAQEDKIDARAAFVKAMTEGERRSITINGFTLSVKHKAAEDKVSVKKAKP